MSTRFYYCHYDYLPLRLLAEPIVKTHLFDGGARGAQMQQSIDAWDAGAAAYRQVVLVSFQEVEDNPAALRILEQVLQVQNKAVEPVSLLNRQRIGNLN